MVCGAPDFNCFQQLQLILSGDTLHFECWIKKYDFACLKYVVDKNS